LFDSKKVITLPATPDMNIGELTDAAFVKLSMSVDRTRVYLCLDDSCGEILDKRLRLSNANKGQAILHLAKFVIVTRGHELGTNTYNPEIGIEKAVWDSLTAKAQNYVEASGLMRASLTATAPLYKFEECMMTGSNLGVNVLRQENGRICVGSFRLPAFNLGGFVWAPKGYAFHLIFVALFNT